MIFDIYRPPKLAIDFPEVLAYFINVTTDIIESHKQ